MTVPHSMDCGLHACRTRFGWVTGCLAGVWRFLQIIILGLLLFAGRVQALGSGGLGHQARRVRLRDDARCPHWGESERACKHDKRCPVSLISSFCSA